ncbi:MAG: hypothetical protein QXI07_09660 [Pyrobaculum sp.]
MGRLKTIQVSEEAFKALFEAKLAAEKRAGRSVSWSEFFISLLKDVEKARATVSACAERGGVRLCIAELVRCCNDDFLGMAYEVTLVKDGRTYRGIGIFIDSVGRDWIVWETYVSEVVDDDTLEDLLNEAFAVWEKTL